MIYDFMSGATPNTIPETTLKRQNSSKLRVQIARTDFMNKIYEKKYMGHHSKSMLFWLTFFIKNSVNTEHFFQKV